MPALEIFKEKLQKREVVFGSTFSSVNNIYLPKTFKGAGVDYMLFDAEHGNFNPENAVDMLQMCRAVDLPTIMRVQDCEYHCISKCIDQGCDGILLPRTETLEQVALAVASMRFFPIGRKGVGGRACLRGETAEQFNQNRLIFIQIESPLGVESLDTILTRYGHEIAGIIIGPSDLSIMCGCPLQYDAEPVVACIRKTIAVSQTHGKSVGMFMGDMDIAKHWYKEGMNIFWTGSETECMQLGLKSLSDSITAL